MVTIKSYTDLQQSRKLAKILPLESADMSWVSCDDGRQKYYQAENRKIILNYEKNHWLPCWSLAALLDIIPGCEVNRMVESNKWEASSWNDSNFELLMRVEGFDNPVNACYEMVLKLNERKML